MKGYERSTPRAALALTAFAMAAITMGVLVVLPAKLDSVSADPYMLAAARAATKAPVDVAISPARIDMPETVDRDEHAHPGRTTLGAHELRGKRHKLGVRVAEPTLDPRDRTFNTQARATKMRILAKERS